MNGRNAATVLFGCQDYSGEKEHFPKMGKIYGNPLERMVDSGSPVTIIEIEDARRIAEEISQRLTGSRHFNNYFKHMNIY